MSNPHWLCWELNRDEEKRQEFVDMLAKTNSKYICTANRKAGNCYDCPNPQVFMRRDCEPDKDDLLVEIKKLREEIAALRMPKRWPNLGG